MFLNFFSSSKKLIIFFVNNIRELHILQTQNQTMVLIHHLYVGFLVSLKFFDTKIILSYFISNKLFLTFNNSHRTLTETFFDIKTESVDV